MKKKKKSLKRKRSAIWLRPEDVVRLVVATATVATILLGLFIVIPDFRPSDFFRSAKAASGQANPKAPKMTLAAANKMRRAQELPYRTSSIIFVSPDSDCEERRFDNTTGRMLSVEDVDCDSRLNRLTSAEEKKERTANIRSVMTSFRK